MVIPDDYKSEYTYINPPPMIKTWLSAITKPTVANYRRLAQHEMAILDTSVRWYLIALVVVALMNIFLGLIASFWPGMGIGNTGVEFSFPEPMVFRPGGSVLMIFGAQACAIPLSVVFTTLLLMFDNWLANRLGGKGTFESLVYISIAWMSPLSILLPIVYRIPFVGTYLIAIQYLFGVYLQIITLRAIKQISLFKSLFIVFFPVILFVAIGIVIALLYAIAVVAG